MILESPPIVFKKISMKYIHEFHKVFNDEELSQFLNCPYPLPRDWARTYINNSEQQNETGEKLTWAIVNKRTRLFIGVGVIKNIDYKNKKVEIGYCLEKGSWFKGYTEKAVILLLEYAFEELEINRIEIKVDCENYKTINFMERIGACQEGRMRQAVFHNGVYYDIYLYSILQDDFLKWRVNKSVLNYQQEQ